MNYGWLLLSVERGKTAALPKLTGRRQLKQFTPLFFHFSGSLGPGMLSQSSLAHSSLLAVLFPTPAAKPSFCRTYKLCIDGLIYVQLMLWFQHSYIIAGTEWWFIKPGHRVFPMHERKTKKGGCKNSRLLPSTLEGSKTCLQNDPNHNKQQKACECPRIWDREAFLTSSLGTPIPSSFQRDEIHAAVHTDISHVSKQSRSHTVKLRGELLKTPRLSVMLKKHHSFLVHLPREGVSWVVRR